MVQARRWFLLISISAITAGTLAAQATSTPQISRSGQQVQIKVPETVALDSLLHAFCSHTGTQCEGIRYVAGKKVAAMNLRGTWTEVVSGLLEGAGVNYVASDGNPPVLMIQQRSAAPVQAANSSPAAQQAPAIDSAEASVPQEPAYIAPAPVEAQDSSSPQPDPTVPDMASDNAGGSGLQPSGPSSAEIASNGQGPQYLPFPDSNGNWIPAVNQQVKVLPFPDSNGNWIPAVSQPVKVLPFPDSNGNWIPVTSQ